MLKRVDTSDIELGMFIHKLEGSWFKHPFWKSRFLLEDERVLESLQASDVPAVIIDTSRGKDVRPGRGGGEIPRLAPMLRGFGQARRAAVQVLPARAHPLRAAHPTAPQSTFREFGTAQKAVTRASKVVSRVFLEARLGKAVAASDVEPVIEDIYASVQRNLYAFNGLLRCRQDSEYVYRHALAVSALMIALARTMKLSPLDMREAGMAGLLMDIGVGQLPVDQVASEGDYRQLDAELLHSHVLLGHALLKAAGDIPDQVLRVCLRHHEALDGSGYPQGLAGDDIDLLSRMAAICDLYDNLICGAPGEPGLDPAEALRRLSAMGPALDPEVLHHFVDTVGVYPIGAFVRLRSERLAMVVDEDPSDSARPTVRVFHSLATGKPIRQQTIALAHCYGEDEIVGSADIAVPDIAGLRERLLAAAARDAG
ncbi:DUF3391 domain-containing protein [Novosphingobium sp. KCTC 2891]|uniref:HD-GYP domain-containing protein n=1 Tax=Novosphingobium sp. KCTC 2891 TaxID=2989730 RepID=UPI002222DA83|nr:HD-GYP domain-containing protein [Novosphingobium sp. KCTC 2891]MCW1383523.1 DUF3391 domain-containing protein [Novosphingobium sp. KCTC 2891]